MVTKEVEIIMKNKAEILKLRNSMKKMINASENIWSRIEQMEGKLSERIIIFK